MWTNEYSYNELSNIYRYANDIIENLDESAILELSQGQDKDIDSIIDTILFETAQVIHSQKDAPIKSASFAYLQKLTSSLEETFRRENLNYFILSVLPTFETNWHHIEWGNFVQLYRNLLVIAARDHSKSFFFSKAYPLWQMYKYQKPTAHSFFNKKNELLKEGVIITNEFKLAKSHLAKIREEIESNPILHEKLYPGTKEDWGKEFIKCKNGASLELRSFGSSMRGLHPGYIIIDDFLDDSCLYSSEQREKFLSIFDGVIMNMIVPGGEVKVVGTPFHSKDLYSSIKAKKGWASFEYPAIFPDGRILWENRYNIQSLLDKRHNQGSIVFSREILVRPVSEQSTIFPYALIERAYRGMDDYTLVLNRISHPKKFLKVAIGCDFARSANVAADYSVFTVLGIDDLNNFWLLNMTRLKGASYNQQIAVLKNLNNAFEPDIVVLESNQMQTLFADGAKEAGLPVLEHNTGVNKYDLKSGVPGMAILFEQDRFKFPRGDQWSKDITDTLALEFSSISWTDKGLKGTGEHDDIPMSIWKAVVGCRYVNSSFDFTFI